MASFDRVIAVAPAPSSSARGRVIVPPQPDHPIPRSYPIPSHPIPSHPIPSLAPAQNLCFRMADWRNLSVLLPEPPQLTLPPAQRALAGKLGRLGWPASFLGPQPKFVPNSADVIASHAIWSRYMAPMTRGGRPFTFTILREPVAQVWEFSLRVDSTFAARAGVLGSLPPL